MKICALIAEYNPFHLGHLKHINYIKKELGAEKVIVIMSGNFTQRGEIAVLNKFTRAKHAIMSGADAVIELPTVFATANAEVFAKGSIKILNSLGCVDGLCFGTESGEKEDFIKLAKILNSESKEYKLELKNQLDSGISLAKAKYQTAQALLKDSIDENIMKTPNNILAIEYSKAILEQNSAIELFPMKRTGNHNDKNLRRGETSASSIREQLKIGKKRKLKPCLPPYVYKDLKPYPYAIDKILMSSILTKSATELEKTPDCTEGLENRIKALSKETKIVESLIEKVSTKRYTLSRIRRILLASFLGITKDFTKECLKSPMYAKLLAVKEESKDIISTLCENSSIPILTRKSDTSKLKKTAKESYEIDIIANDIYNLVNGENTNENFVLQIK